MNEKVPIRWIIYGFGALLIALATGSVAGGLLVIGLASVLGAIVHFLANDFNWDF